MPPIINQQYYVTLKGSKVIYFLKFQRNSIQNVKGKIHSEIVDVNSEYFMRYVQS